MKAKARKDIEVTIIMDELEARWLRGVMQNPLYGETLESERKQDLKMRLMFWRILDKERIKL